MSINAVAPLAGAWIEILLKVIKIAYFNVAPLAGAWIEIWSSTNTTKWLHASLPSRERGLKFPPFYFVLFPYVSLPSRERGLKSPKVLLITANPSRSPRGSVD